MNVLLVTQAFPPFNTSGAVRVGKLAEYLLGRKHDVRVITASPLPYPQTLAIDVPPQCVITTRSADPLVTIQRLRRSARSPAGIAGRAAAKRADSAAIRLLASIAIPEPQVGWYPSAVAAGRRLLRTWPADAIYASALPFTAHLVAATLARGARVPWVAEFRDHYAGNPYSNLPHWREPVDRWIERRVVASAAACVTVSDPMAQTLRNRYGKPTVVVLNGFDDRDLADSGARSPGDERLSIVYTGLIYPGRRDPSALFAAIGSLGALDRQIEVVFYGQDLRGVEDIASRHGVSSQVRVHRSIGYAESLAAQRTADVLLLLLWNDPREAGVYTGKLFEYIGAGRPVLAVGGEAGVAVDLIRGRGLGVASADPTRIAAALREWIAEKRRLGFVRGPSRAAREGLSRAEQFARVDELLCNLVRQPTTTAGCSVGHQP